MTTSLSNKVTFGTLHAGSSSAAAANRRLERHSRPICNAEGQDRRPALMEYGGERGISP